MFTYSCSGPVCQVSGNNPHQLNSSVQILKDALRLTFCQIQNSNLYTPDLRVFKWAVKFFPQQVIYIQEELAYRGSLSISLISSASQPGATLPSPRLPGTFACQETFSLSQLEDATWHLVGGSQDAPKHPPQQRIIWPKLLIVLRLKNCVSEQRADIVRIRRH